MPSVSTNFGLHEFTRAIVAAKKFTVKLSPVGYYLAETLARDVLEPIRAHVCKRVHVTSGARSWTVYDAMIRDREGDPSRSKPSKTSDHNYANHVYPYGVGATDITFQGIDPLRLITWILAEGIPVGQAIAYPTGRFVHISNPRDVLLSEGAISTLPVKDRFLIWTPAEGYRSIE